MRLMATIVLLHPFPVDSRFWDDVIPPLEVAGHSVMAPDLPGFGSRAAEPGWSLRGEADTLAGQVPEGAMVVGLSMGGYLALALTAAHPDRVGRLVLAARRATAEGLRANGTADFVAAFVPRAMWPGAEPAAVKRLTELASGQSADAMADATMAIAGRDDSTGLLPGISVPTLVVVGEHDAITPPPLSTAMATAIPGARLAVIGGAGHMTALEHPVEFAALLTEHAA